MKKTHIAAGVLAVAAIGATIWGFQPATVWSFQSAGDARPVIPEALKGYQVATFAGGCFWCVEAGFEKVPGVVAAISGYGGGKEKNPTYHEVGGGKTGHTEVVQVYYDDKEISYDGLLQAFWRMMDPTDVGGQFSDRGSQYRPAIFYHNEKEKDLAEMSKAALDKSKRFSSPVVLDVVPFTTFYNAEDYHQDYYKKNPLRYSLYTRGSGRTDFVEDTWGDDLKLDYAKFKPAGAAFTKPSREEIKKQLTPLQYEVTQEEGTETPFQNAYWDEKREGLYVDIVSGEPLFSSKDKFKSGTGWPSFTRPIKTSNIVEKTDQTLFMTRVEIRSGIADSHLGHVFDDGPAPTGKRYCINSASLRFVPAEKLVAEGYSEFEAQFTTKGM